MQTPVKEQAKEKCFDSSIKYLSLCTLNTVYANKITFWILSTESHSGKMKAGMLTQSHLDQPQDGVIASVENGRWADTAEPRTTPLRKGKLVLTWWHFLCK